MTHYEDCRCSDCTEWHFAMWTEELGPWQRLAWFAFELELAEKGENDADH
jgi:hypothetical protein